MPDLAERLENILTALDEVGNSLAGGKPRETISGTVGRACRSRLWWGPILRAVIEAMPWFGRGHCERQAATEQARRTSA